MAIDAIQIRNIMAFRCPRKQESSSAGNPPEVFQLSFSDRINVLTGMNGTGKSSILKMIYSAAQLSKKDSHFFGEYVSPNENTASALKSLPDTGDSFFRVSDGSGQKCCCSVNNGDSQGVYSYGVYSYTMAWETLHISAVFIPAQEMLSHAPGFLALYHMMKIPFDRTLADIIANASLPEARTLPPYMDAVLDKISAAVGGTVVQENDTFYVLKEGGEKIEFSLEAEGLRKLGLLWKLIRNGLLNEGSVLLWDEPEANLNPELFPLVADILLELTRNGVQIFAATHSYNFAKYLEIRRGKPEDVTFHNLVKNNAGGIDAFTASTMEGLPRNPIMEADLKLLDEVFQAG